MTWKAYESSGVFGAPTLPDGFTAATMKNYYDTAKTPVAATYDCMFADEPTSDYHIVYFNVARILEEGAFSGYYLAIEERVDFSDKSEGQESGVWEEGMRISPDLVHWSEFVPTRDPVPGGWGFGTLQYPTFVNRHGSSNYDIDRCEFYVLGNRPNSGYALYSHWLSLDIEGFPPCP